MTNKFTAVFEVQDKQAFSALLNQIKSSMCGEDTISGATVTGCGWCDSMTEADRMAEFLGDKGYDAGEIAGVDE